MRTAPPSLCLNATWALAGNIAYTACQWGVFIIIAKLGTALDLGRFALGLAVTAPVLVLSNLNLRAVQATDARLDYPFGVYLGLRLVTATLAFAAIAVGSMVAGYRDATLRLILAVAIAKVLESVSDVVFGLLQRAENLRRIAFSRLAKGALSVLSVAGVMVSGLGLETAILAMAVCWAGVLMLIDLPAGRSIAAMRADLAPRELARLAWLALPLGCVMALNTLSINVPRYAIESHLGTTALGHFAAVAYLLVAASQPVLALGAALSPRLAHYFLSDRGAYARLSLRALLAAASLGACGVIVAVLAGKTVLRLAYAPDYAAHADLLCWIAVVACVGFASSTLGFSVTAARRFREQLLIAILALTTCTLASQWLVPWYGLVGAAWALLATEFVRLASLSAVYLAACTPARRGGHEMALSRMPLDGASTAA